MIKEIVTWTNQKIENVKTSYTSESKFMYNTSVTEIRELIGILLFLGTTKSSKESTASILAKDGAGHTQTHTQTHTYLPTYLPTYPPTHPPNHLPTHTPNYPPTYLPTNLSTYPTTYPPN